VPDYANGLVKVVVILGVINCVHAAIPEHNVFCYSSVAHILTPSVNLAFRPKSGFKKKCRARFGLRLQNETLLQLRVDMYARGQQGEIEKIHLPPTNSKCRVKSFCEVGYTNFRPNVFGAAKRISMEILVRVGLHAGCPVALQRFLAFSKSGNVQEKYLSSS